MQWGSIMGCERWWLGDIPKGNQTNLDCSETSDSFPASCFASSALLLLSSEPNSSSTFCFSASTFVRRICTSNWNTLRFRFHTFVDDFQKKMWNCLTISYFMDLFIDTSHDHQTFSITILRCFIRWEWSFYLLSVSPAIGSTTLASVDLWWIFRIYGGSFVWESYCDWLRHGFGYTSVSKRAITSTSLDRQTPLPQKTDA